MKLLGVKQFHQKTFKLLDIAGSIFEYVLGKIPVCFFGVIYGFSGNGKTEFCIQLAKFLTRYGKVAWISYEQGHGYDLQLATVRNNMDEHVGKFMIIDPNEKRKDNVSYVEELDAFLGRRNSPQFVFIDSLDYLNLKFEEYKYLKEKYARKKSIIFIAHAFENGKPILSITRKIIFDSGFGILVKDYIAKAKKNRFGGFEPYVIWEEKAREINPSFFAKRPASAKATAGKKKAAPHRRKPASNGHEPACRTGGRDARASDKLVSEDTHQGEGTGQPQEPGI